MANIKCIIADDHKIFRQGLTLALSEHTGIQIIGEAADGNDLLELLKIKRPDVIFLDLKMPGMDGRTALHHIREKYPDIKVLILTMFDDENLILHMIESGANGYLLKNADAADIRKAALDVYRNEYFFNGLISGALLNRVLGQKLNGKPGSIKLTEREQDILKLICQEMTNAEIAERVFLSTRTVEGIRSSLIEKLNVRNTAGLVLYAVRNNLLD
jgi:DNA-binding NarL/FixJ family response regulator